MKETRLVSIDSSTTCTGIVLWVNGKLKEYKTLVPKIKSPTEKRIMEMARLITETLSEWKPNIVYAETPQGKNNIKLSRMLGEVLGVVIGWCSVNDCNFNEVNPSWWRKWNFWDQGKLERDDLKKLSIQKAKEIHGIESTSDDLCDAIHLGQGVINYFESLECDQKEEEYDA